MSGRSFYNDLYGDDGPDEYDELENYEQLSPPARSDTGLSLIPEQIEDLGRKVTATAEHLFNSSTPVNTDSYRSAIQGFRKKLKEPRVQRRMYSIATSGQSEPAPSLLAQIPFTRFLLPSPKTVLSDRDLGSIIGSATKPSYNLIDGFRASTSQDFTRSAQKLLADGPRGKAGRGLSANPDKRRLQLDEAALNLRLNMTRTRKKMTVTEIDELDAKILALETLRTAAVGRLTDVEQEELDVESRLIDVQAELDEWDEDESEPESETGEGDRDEIAASSAASDSRQGESDLDIIDMPSPALTKKSLQKLNGDGKPASVSSHKKSRRSLKRISVPILHEHLPPGSLIRQLRTGHDTITALDFDRPFGLMLTSGTDENVFVWELSQGRRIGRLKGHLSSVRCLQVEGDRAATGSVDATVRIWDLTKADHDRGRLEDESLFTGSENDILSNNTTTTTNNNSSSYNSISNNSANNVGSSSTHTLDGCDLLTLELHMAEVTALHFQADTLVSGSADKTIRQWDLVKGRCVQTLDLILPLAQSAGPAVDLWRPESDPAGFVGALHHANYDLFSGTADGVVRVWDLRAGQVSQTLIGHTGPVTGLHLEDNYLISSSSDKSIRIWDLRTGTLFDAYGYDQPVTSMSACGRRVAAAAGEAVVKIYDRLDDVHYDCGPGTAKPSPASAAAAAADEGAAASALPAAAPLQQQTSAVRHVRLQDRYLVEGREDGLVSVWAC